MKLADGLFLESCREVASKYPSIEYNEIIVDNCCMQLVQSPSKLKSWSCDNDQKYFSQIALSVCCFVILNVFYLINLRFKECLLRSPGILSILGFQRWGPTFYYNKTLIFCLVLFKYNCLLCQYRTFGTCNYFDYYLMWGSELER